MKYILLFTTLFSTLAVFSQDTLYTREGQVIPAKVYEVTQTEIKYKKPSNPDGPMYVVSKDDIAVIEYKNGSKDVFQSSGSGQADASNNAQQGSQPQVNNYYSNPQPNVNLMLGLGMMGGYWGAPGWGWGWYRPWYRPYNSWGWRHHYRNYGWHHGHHRR